MRRELSKECRKLFRKMMNTEFSQYCEDKGQIVPSGRYVWTHRDSSNLWFHVLLIINPQYDKFTIESAWSFDGKLPGHTYGEETVIFERPSLFRPNFFWSDKDYWWLLVLRPEEFERAILYKDDPIEQCLPLVAPAVQDAAERLKKHVVPIFEQIVEKHGNRLSQ